MEREYRGVQNILFTLYISWFRVETKGPGECKFYTYKYNTQVP